MFSSNCIKSIYRPWHCRMNLLGTEKPDFLCHGRVTHMDPSPLSVCLSITLHISVCLGMP